MKILKIILMQGEDLIFGVITLGLLIWHIITGIDFTGFLFLVIAYVSFNIISKVRWVNEMMSPVSDEFFRKIYIEGDVKKLPTKSDYYFVRRRNSNISISMCFFDNTFKKFWLAEIEWYFLPVDFENTSRDEQR